MGAMPSAAGASAGHAVAAANSAAKRISGSAEGGGRYSDRSEANDDDEVVGAGVACEAQECEAREAVAAAEEGWKKDCEAAEETGAALTKCEKVLYCGNSSCTRCLAQLWLARGCVLACACA